MAKKTSSRNAQGAGTIRKKTITAKGKTYTRWEARYTVGRDPGTGKQMQKSIYGSTQKEVREKLQAIEVALSSGIYITPEKMTVGEWLDLWLREYVADSVKPFTLSSYAAQCKNHIKPNLGAIRLTALNTAQIQKFYNKLKTTKSQGNGRENTLSPKTIKNIHGVLHKALDKAAELRYIAFNPSDPCTLPRMQKKEIKPLEQEDVAALLRALDGDRHEHLFTVILFTGMREGEALGLTWDCVNFTDGTILINKQLQREKKKGGKIYLAETKSGKSRLIKPAPSVMYALKAERARQSKERLSAGGAWQNKYNLVFTNEIGSPLIVATLHRRFKKLADQIGKPETRIHDLRHTFAVMSLQEGDDIKTVQGNLGHATASFTLDVYGHVSEKMKKESADRMEALITKVKKA